MTFLRHRPHLIGAIVIGVVAAALAPFAATPVTLPTTAAPLAGMAILLCDLLTAYLLREQARAGESRNFLFLGAAYFFAACTLVPHLLGGAATVGLFPVAVALSFVPALRKLETRPRLVMLAAAVLSAVSFVAIPGYVVVALNAAATVYAFFAIRGHESRPIEHWAAVAALAGTVFSWVGAPDTVGYAAALGASVVAAALVVAVLLRDLGGLYGEVMRLATTDELTGLANRRVFDAELANELERLNRYQTPVSLLLLDLDSFKQVNDVHGHLVGDLVLHEFAQRVVASVRGIDVVARYGGEQIAVILPGTWLKNAIVVAERIRDAVEGTPFSAGAGEIELTVSAGVAGARGETAAVFVADADAALYRAKRAGRNRVEVAMPLGTHRSGVVLIAGST